MRAIVLHAPGDFRLEERQRPQAGADKVVVRVRSVGVCGSDWARMLVKGAHKMPLVTGHEFSGEIADLGPSVTGWEIGELVAIPPLLPCYKCDQCKTGNYSRCRNYDYFGSRRDGAYAEFVAVPVGNLLKVPQNSDPRAIAMVDPASIALHSLWKAGGMTVGQTGAVVGCGPIGLYAIQWMRLMGATDVIAVDVSQDKLDLAMEAGATVGLFTQDVSETKMRADVVVEAVGIDATINAAMSLGGPGGHVSFIGIPVPAVTVDNAVFQAFLRQELSLHGSWNSFSAPFPGKQWTETVAALSDGRLKWEFLISHDLDLSELPRIFEEYKAGKLSYSKVMFRP